MRFSPQIAYKQDILEMRRRDILKLGAAAVAAPPMGSIARTDTTELTVANFGGDAVKAVQTAYGELFTKDTGIAVRIDGALMRPGKIKASAMGILDNGILG